MAEVVSTRENVGYAGAEYCVLCLTYTKTYTISLWSRSSSFCVFLFDTVTACDACWSVYVLMCEAFSISGGVIRKIVDTFWTKPWVYFRV